MNKKHPYGTVKNYDAFADGDWIVNRIRNTPDWEPNLFCDCGSDKFKVCWWDYPYTGGFCRVVCSDCGADMVLIDDYA